MTVGIYRPEKATIASTSTNKSTSSTSSSNNRLLQSAHNGQNVPHHRQPRRYNSFRSTATTSSGGTKSKIPLPPSQGRSRTESNSSFVESVKSSRSISVRSKSSRTTTGAGSDKHSVAGGSITRSISARSRSSTAKSKYSTGSANNSKLLSSSPKFLPWAFQNVSSNLLPSEHEIEDYDHSVLLNRQRSMSSGGDSLSSLNNESEGSSFVGNSNGNGNSSLSDAVSPLPTSMAGSYYSQASISNFQNPNNNNMLYKDQLIPMDTIHSSHTALFDSMNTIDTDLYSRSTPVAGSTRKTARQQQYKPPLHHQHKRSHSADFIEILQQQQQPQQPQQNDSLLTKKLKSPSRHTTNNSNKDARNTPTRSTNSSKQDYGALGNLDYTLSPIRNSVSNSSIDTREGKPLLQEQALLLRPPPQQHQLTKQYDLGQYDLYEDETQLNVTTVHAWGSSKVSVLGQNSAGTFQQSKILATSTRRSLRRRIFLLLTEPQTSILSAVVFTIYFIMLLASVTVMMMQTVRMFQYTPKECTFCDTGISNYTDDTVFHVDSSSSSSVPSSYVECVCAPIPKPFIVNLEHWMIYFFSVEWALRVMTYEPLITEEKEHLTFWE